MDAYLITARGGVGKSAICKELIRRGYDACDTDDIPGFARWEDSKTGRFVAVDPAGFIDYTKVGWNWNERAFGAFLAKHSNQPLFMCGSASNQEAFYHHFKKVFYLTITPDIHQQRLATRDSAYGKHPAMMRQLLQDQESFVALSDTHGALRIDASRPITDVVDEIITYAA